MHWREERRLLRLDGQAWERQVDQALLVLAEQLLRAADATAVATSLLEHATVTYGLPRGAVLAVADRRLSQLAAHGVLESPRGTGTSRAVMRALTEARTQVVSALSPQEEPWLSRLLPVEADVLVVPLVADDHRAGALVLQLPLLLRGDEGEQVLSQVERAAAFAAHALHRAQRLTQLTRLAATDDLTMIPNRRSFLAALDRELARAVRRSEPLSLVLLDIDHFKQVNDEHGHPAGDEALRNVAASLSIACRDLDTAARYGGEEFVVLLPDSDAEQCVAVAERLRQAVAAAPAACALTASAGVATFPTHANDGESLLKAADEALLQAKRAGRDQTVLSQRVPSDDRERDTRGRRRPAPPNGDGHRGQSGPLVR